MEKKRITIEEFIELANPKMRLRSILRFLCEVGKLIYVDEITESIFSKTRNAGELSYFQFKELLIKLKIEKSGKDLLVKEIEDLLKQLTEKVDLLKKTIYLEKIR